VARLGPYLRPPRNGFLYGVVNADVAGRRARAARRNWCTTHPARERVGGALSDRTLGALEAYNIMDAQRRGRSRMRENGQESKVGT
jgi:hypothetical protein